MLTFTVDRDNTALISDSIVVNLLVGGTAIFGTDYTVSSADTFTSDTATLTIPAGELSASIFVTPIPDAVFEPDQTVILTILPSPGVSQLGANNVAIGYILDDDTPPFVDPYNANVVFFAMFEGVNNSATFTDTKGNAINVRSGVPRISTAQSMFGSGSLYLDGSSSLVVPASASLVSGSQEFEWEIALYPTLFLAGNAQGILDQRAVGNATPEAIFIENQLAAGSITYETGSTVRALSRLKLDQWQILTIKRHQGVRTIYIDDIPVFSGSDTTAYNSVGNFIIGDMIDTALPYSGMFTGYIQYLRKTIGVSRSQGYGTDALTFLKPSATDQDPLDAFKVLDINCDTGVIVDAKSHVITPTGAVAVSAVQKRAGSNSIALTGGHLDIAGGTDFNFGTLPYSIHCSAQFSTLGVGGSFGSPDTQYLIDFNGGNANTIEYTSNGSARIKMGVAGGLQVNSNLSPIINKWYDLVQARVDQKYLLIINNQIAGASQSGSIDNTSYNSLRVGNYNGGLARNFLGYLDSISLYKGIANGANLTHNYQLRFLARFDGSPNDELGAVGTIIGTAHTYDVANKRSLGASALFAGSGYISYPSSPAYDFGAGGFEIAGWIKAEPTQLAYPAILSIGTTTGTIDAPVFTIYSNVQSNTSLSGKSTVGKLSVLCAVVNTNSTYLCSATTITDGLPHYFRIIKYPIGASAATVLIMDGKIEDVYIGAYTIPTSTRAMLVGSDNYDPSNRGYKGNLDDIAIYTQ
jgi:hypothetical protein